MTARRLLFVPCLVTHLCLAHFSKFSVRLPPRHTLLPTHHFPLLSSHCSYLFVTLSSWHPSRATWTRRLGCLGRMCSLPPLPTYPRCPQSTTFQASSRSHFSCTTPFTSNPGVLPWSPRWGRSWFLVRSRLVALMICLPSVLDFAKGLHPASLLFVDAVGFSVSF